MLDYLTPPFCHAFTASVASTATQPSRWPAYAFAGGTLLQAFTFDAGGLQLAYELSRDLAQVPAGGKGVETPWLDLQMTLTSTGHVDVALYAMGRDVDGPVLVKVIRRFEPCQRSQ